MLNASMEMCLLVTLNVMGVTDQVVTCSIERELTSCRLINRNELNNTFYYRCEIWHLHPVRHSSMT